MSTHNNFSGPGGLLHPLALRLVPHAHRGVGPEHLQEVLLPSGRRRVGGHGRRDGRPGVILVHRRDVGVVDDVAGHARKRLAPVVREAVRSIVVVIFLFSPFFGRRCRPAGNVGESAKDVFQVVWRLPRGRMGRGSGEQLGAGVAEN